MRRQCSCGHMNSSSVSTSMDRNQSNQVRLFYRVDQNEQNAFILSKQSTTESSSNTTMNRWTWSIRNTGKSIHVESDEPLTGEIDDDKRAFHAYFARHVSAMAQKISERFPYRHVIHWSMHINDRCQHDLDIEVRAPHPTHRN